RIGAGGHLEARHERTGDSADAFDRSAGNARAVAARLGAIARVPVVAAGVGGAGDRRDRGSDAPAGLALIIAGARVPVVAGAAVRFLRGPAALARNQALAAGAVGLQVIAQEAHVAQGLVPALTRLRITIGGAGVAARTVDRRVYALAGAAVEGVGGTFIVIV